MLREKIEAMGRKVVLGKEPGGTELGVAVRQILFHTIETQNMAPNVCDALFLADHVQHAETLVKPAIAEGSVVISDRYAFSQYAYSVDRKIHPFLDAAYRDLLGPVPDVIFLLVGTPEHLLERAQGRQVETHQAGKKWNNADSQRHIQDAYYKLLVPYKQTVIVPTDVLDPQALFDLYIWPAAEEMFNPKAERERRHCVLGPEPEVDPDLLKALSKAKSAEKVM
jgi:dTMP kinase